MQRLTGLDATFLYLETPNIHMHVASTCVFDPSTVPGGYSFERMRALVEERLPLLPPFRRRLVEVPFQIHHPLWIEDPDFDLDYHVRRAALPAPGGDQELAEFAAEVHGRPLDRRRPLWEMYVVEGLENGMIATVTKTHHAAIDGVSGAELTVNLLDLQAEPAPVPEEKRKEWKADREPTDVELVLYAARSLARQPLLALKSARRTLEMAWGLRQRNRRPGVNPPPAPFSAPRTSLNTSITPHRRFAYTSVALDEVKQVKNALGGTVNDVVLALCAGALKQYLADEGEAPDKPLVGMVPVSVRTEDQKGAMGNRVSSMLVSLATDIDDPVERLHAISAGTVHAKDQEKAIGAEFLTDWTEFAAPAVAARAARLYSSMRLADRHNPFFNVTISNVPGPGFPLYSAGARMVAMYPMGPIADGGGLNITVMSYMGQMFFGLVACRETVPKVWNIAHYLNDALEELKKAADRPGRPGPAKKAAAPAKRAAGRAKRS
ncbi:MAG TPA: wax ester/triacylglycerol synthase family O-acyltransferase [Acidimicrobiales bacterium]|jgi:WS/DGAT/MGAT family acyltransferase|nr:wax ester/triacylglycerol synthase family O-acyltransferase [Acidimicrobiales bacterium]